MRKKILGKVDLQTERDGRLYAIAMLERMEEETEKAQRSLWTAETEHELNGRIVIARNEPQRDTLARCINYVYQHGTQEARNGFFVIFTDWMGAIIEYHLVGHGLYDLDRRYTEQERGEGFAPWGSVVYRDSKAAAEAIASDKWEYRLNAKPTRRKTTKQASGADRPRLSLLVNTEEREHGKSD